MPPGLGDSAVVCDPEGTPEGCRCASRARLQELTLPGAQVGCKRHRDFLVDSSIFKMFGHDTLTGGPPLFKINYSTFIKLETVRYTLGEQWWAKAHAVPQLRNLSSEGQALIKSHKTCQILIGISTVNISPM